MKKLIISVTILVIFLGVGVALYFSPAGNNFLKEYIVSKICFGGKFKAVYFNHSFNSFSLLLKNGQNTVQVYGSIFPFKANYNAKIAQIGALFPKFNGEMLAMGDVEPAKIKGDLFFAKGNAKINLMCKNHNITGEIKGEHFNSYCFVKMFNKLNYILKKFDISLKGTNNLDVHFKKYILLKSEFKGSISVMNNEINAVLNSKFDYDKNSFSYKGVISGSDIDGYIKVNNNENGMQYFASFERINLILFKKFILIPIKKDVSFNIFYDPVNKLYDFSSRLFSGFYKNGSLVFQFKMPSKDFFTFLSLPEVFNGAVIGNVHIDTSGNFNILVKNVLFNKFVFKYLQKYAKVKYVPNVRGKIFLTGKFDDKKAVFDLISKDLNCFWSIKNGVYYFNGKYNFILKLNTGEYTYTFDINNSDVKLLNKTGNNQHIETLVY